MQEPLFEAGSHDPSGPRSGLGHLNDLFSQFARYIAPTYHHERPERSIQMRLYTLFKGQYLLIFIMFFCLFFIALLMGMAGPRMILEHDEKATELLKHYRHLRNLSSGPFEIVTPSLGTYRQQLWISAQILIKENDQATFSIDCKAILSIEGLVDRNTKVLIGHKDISRERKLTCKKRTCDPFVILHLGALEYSHYFVNITFEGLATVDKYFTLEDIIFRITTYNPDFTHMEVWFRFFFVIATIIVALGFLVSMRHFSLEDWSIEQKWTSILLPALLAFNNPIFPLTLTSTNLFPALTDMFFQATFLFLLLLFWLCIFHGLRQTERTFWGFYFIKVSIVGSMWFSAIITTSLEEVNQLRDPSFSYELNDAHYQRFQMFFLAAMAVYTVYLIYLALRAFGELRSMNFLDSRLKFHSASLIIVLLLTLSIVINRYGTGVLEDNFIARIYTSYNSEAQFLAFYTVLNCYVYVMTYVYTPTVGQAKENHLLKDNPAMSMINESDEDDDDASETEAMLVPDLQVPPTTMPKTYTQNNSETSKMPLILSHDDDSD